jgi:hypothetical protein
MAIKSPVFSNFHSGLWLGRLQDHFVANRGAPADVERLGVLPIVSVWFAEKHQSR